MKVGDLVEKIEGEVLAKGNLDTEIKGCYVSDLLSDVLANSQPGNLWVTQHTHPNVVAVAAVKDISGVLIVGGKPIDPETLKRAQTEKVNLVVCKLSAFEAAGVVYNLLSSEGKA